MGKYFVVVLFFGLFAFGYGAKLPSSFKICSRNDPKISECLKEAIAAAFPLMRDGIPEINTAPLEPLNVPSVTIGEGTGPVNVLQKYNNLDIHNLTMAKIDYLSAKVVEPFELILNVSAPQYVLTADFDFNGRILLLPIVGKGKCVITLDKPKTDMVITAMKTEKKGVTYMKIQDFKVTLNPEKVIFDFENLFNGDARLANEMNKLLNENWKEVFTDVKGGYEEFIGSIGKHVANGIFSKVPYDDLFPSK